MRKAVTRRSLGRAHVPPTKVFWQYNTTIQYNKKLIKRRSTKPARSATKVRLGEQNHFKTTPRCSGGARHYVYVGFPRRKIPRSTAYTISEKATRFRHPDYKPDRAQKLISSSMSRHLSTRNISSKSMDAFLSNLANRETDKWTRTKTFISSFVGGN